MSENGIYIDRYRGTIVVPEREVEDGGETEIERDRGRKLKWSQWCGTIVVA